MVETLFRADNLKKNDCSFQSSNGQFNYSLCPQNLNEESISNYGLELFPQNNNKESIINMYHSLSERYFMIEQENDKLSKLSSLYSKRIEQLEVESLRTQISPHFIYNVLSSIYTKIKKQSPEVAEQIMILSEIMSYATPKTTLNQEVLLEDEIENILRYLALQNIRYIKESTFVFKQTGNADNAQILPLILLTFIENAFKYGDRSYPEHPITIVLNITDNDIFFSCRNKKYLNSPVKRNSTKIGLINTQKRLEINYSDRYKLNINDEKDFYEVQLSLKI